MPTSLTRITALTGALLAFAVPAAAAPPDGKGVNSSIEPKSTGTPGNPDGWGSVVSQCATQSTDACASAGSFGAHAADPTPGDDQPRLGVGNVARNDCTNPDNDVQSCDEAAGRPGDHAAVVGDNLGADANARPGKPQ
jgi:hypothetical protein